MCCITMTTKKYRCWMRDLYKYLGQALTMKKEAYSLTIHFLQIKFVAMPKLCLSLCELCGTIQERFWCHRRKHNMSPVLVPWTYLLETPVQRMSNKTKSWLPKIWNSTTASGWMTERGSWRTRPQSSTHIWSTRQQRCGFLYMEKPNRLSNLLFRTTPFNLQGWLF